MAVTDAAATTPQHMSALARANTVRLAGAEIKRELAGGDTTVRAALYDERAGSLTVFDLLCAQRRWGRQRTVKLLSFLVIPETKRVDALTDRQRRTLARYTAQGGPA